MEIKAFWEFAPFRVDPVKRLLFRDEVAVSLPGKALDVLMVLLQNHGRTVTKDELMKAVWPDTFVEEGNLSQTIFVLRKTLGDADEVAEARLSLEAALDNLLQKLATLDGELTEVSKNWDYAMDQCAEENRKTLILDHMSELLSHRSYIRHLVRAIEEEL